MDVYVSNNCHSGLKFYFFYCTLFSGLFFTLFLTVKLMDFGLGFVHACIRFWSMDFSGISISAVHGGCLV
jgi:hypothetical protein